MLGPVYECEGSGLSSIVLSVKLQVPPEVGNPLAFGVKEAVNQNTVLLLSGARV